eukprot:2829014-Prymnesium_polylepis.2
MRRLSESSLLTTAAPVSLCRSSTTVPCEPLPSTRTRLKALKSVAVRALCAESLHTIRQPKDAPPPVPSQLSARADHRPPSIESRDLLRDGPGGGSVVCTDPSEEEPSTTVRRSAAILASSSAA